MPNHVICTHCNGKNKAVKTNRRPPFHMPPADVLRDYMQASALDNSFILQDIPASVYNGAIERIEKIGR